MSSGESVYFLGSRFDTGSVEEAVSDILAGDAGMLQRCGHTERAPHG